MLRKASVSFLLACFVFSAFAQDTIPKNSNRYIGVQINQLIRQILNFSSSSTAVNNPYLITYAVNSRQTGWGANFGLGYTFNEFNDGDAFLRRRTKINDFFFRVGFERKSGFGKRWILSSGIDALIDLQNNTTRTTQSGISPSNTTTTKNKNNGWGLGPRVTLNYTITDRMLIGTEATYYFKSLKNTIETQGQGGVSDDKTTEKSKRFQLVVPAVIFMVLKF
jgi:hypothetical protein